jgi:lipopolysaccharide/colanic/teichoic acid biosynthesis glycosyltransferase
MRILYATQWFEPEPILKGIYFAKLLRAQGHDVQVVTGFPNYPGGKLYPGYRLTWLRREIMDDIPIDRLPLYPSHSRSAIGRTLNYISFALSLTIYGLFIARRPDVMYVYHPPLTVGLAAAVVSVVRRIPFVFAIHDMWPDTLAASGMVSNRVVLRVTGRLCHWVYARADRLIVVSPGFRRNLVEKGIPPSKVDVIYNWPNEVEAQPRGESDLTPFALEGRFNIVYAGNIGAAQGLETVLHAAKIVERVAPSVQFVLVGEGIEVERLRAVAAKLGTQSVRIMPRVPPSQIGDLLAAADVLLVHLKDTPLFRITIPAKTQFYLAMGKPILMGVRGDAADLIEQSGAGILVKPEDAKALAAGALELAAQSKTELADMGARGRAFYERELSAAQGVPATLAILDAAVRARRRDSILKRGFDLIVASAALVLLSPILFATAAVLAADLGFPVLFRQVRPGRDGRPYWLYKFRTMRELRDPTGQPLPDADRLTGVGKIVRRLSLDELPQLWNVVIGDMSLVGPRPLLAVYLDRYTQEQARRHEVRPGITGWAQINGRNAISWDEKLALDVWYVNNRSFLLDLKILAMTAVQVLRGQGVSAAGHATMEEFRGTADAGDQSSGPQKSRVDPTGLLKNRPASG